MLLETDTANWVQILDKTAYALGNGMNLNILPPPLEILWGRLSGCVDTAKWMHYMDQNKTYGEKA